MCLGRNDEALTLSLHRSWLGLLERGDGRGCSTHGSRILVLHFDITRILKISLTMMSTLCKRIFILLSASSSETVKIAAPCGLGIGNIILRCSTFWPKSAELTAFVPPTLSFLCKLCYVTSFWLKKQ